MPAEILYHVCSFLPKRDLKSCVRVNSVWNEVATRTLYPRLTLRANPCVYNVVFPASLRISWHRDMPAKLVCFNVFLVHT